MGDLLNRCCKKEEKPPIDEIEKIFKSILNKMNIGAEEKNELQDLMNKLENKFQKVNHIILHKIKSALKNVKGLIEDDKRLQEAIENCSRKQRQKLLKKREKLSLKIIKDVLTNYATLDWFEIGNEISALQARIYSTSDTFQEKKVLKKQYLQELKEDYVLDGGDDVLISTKITQRQPEDEWYHCTIIEINTNDGTLTVKLRGKNGLLLIYVFGPENIFEINYEVTEAINTLKKSSDEEKRKQAKDFISKFNELSEEQKIGLFEYIEDSKKCIEALNIYATQQTNNQSRTSAISKCENMNEFLDKEHQKIFSTAETQKSKTYVHTRSIQTLPHYYELNDNVTYPANETTAGLFFVMLIFGLLFFQLFQAMIILYKIVNTHPEENTKEDNKPDPNQKP